MTDLVADMAEGGVLFVSFGVALAFAIEYRHRLSRIAHLCKQVASSTSSVPSEEDHHVPGAGLMTWALQQELLRPNDKS
jgi:hypothetical protein